MNFQPMGSSAPRASVMMLEALGPDAVSRASSVVGGIDRQSVCSNVSMVSNVVELSVCQAAEPEVDKVRQLNNDPVFDQDDEDRDWRNWGIKTFTPVKPSPREHGAITTHNFSGYSKSLYDIKDPLEQKGEKFEDLKFRPTMATLRGFGGDCTWE